LKEGRDVILLPSSTYSAEGFSAEDISVFTQRLMGQLTVNVLEKVEISGLFLSGGDTAVCCFENADALGSRIESEIALGIPLMRLIGGRYDGLKVVTKAGAFGNEDAIFYGFRKLKERERC
jgi:uncharacterized protein YgbK (DUF1537 family)